MTSLSASSSAWSSASSSVATSDASHSAANADANSVSNVTAALSERAGAVRLMAFDVDGVFTDGRIYYGHDGDMMKAFNTLDGHGVKQLAQCGIEVAIITGRASGIVASRAAELGITRVFQGVKRKDDVLASLRADLALRDDQIGYMGDDWPDLPVLTRVGFACAPANAHPDVRARVHYVCAARGGEGAVREACDVVLRATGQYDALLAMQCRTPAGMQPGMHGTQNGDPAS